MIFSGEKGERDPEMGFCSFIHHVPRNAVAETTAKKWICSSLSISHPKIYKLLRDGKFMITISLSRLV